MSSVVAMDYTPFSGEPEGRTVGATPYAPAAEQLVLPASAEYKQQYAHLYFCRLAALKPRVMAAVEAAHPAGEMPPVLSSILELTEESPDIVIVGTLFKSMANKHTILDEFVKESWTPAPPVNDSYVADDDALVLEDESGRIALTGAPDILPVARLVTGVVTAVRGALNADGVFEVVQMYMPGSVSPPRPPMPTGSDSPSVMMFVSDLGIGSADAATQLARDMLLDWLAGNVGGPDDRALAASVERVVVAGSALAPLPPVDPDAGRAMDEAPLINIDAVNELDAYMAGLASAAQVVYMAGSSDPTNYFYPLQPLHASLLRTAKRYTSLSLAGSPHIFDAAGIRFAGESGDAINDARRYMDPDLASSPQDALALVVQWSHMAPTCPETLPAYPFTDSDPFILRETPHLYFAGSQPVFGVTTTSAATGPETVCLAVPSFASTHTVALVVVNPDGSIASASPLSFSAAL